MSAETGHDERLRQHFLAFAETTVSRAPLYSRLSRAIADDPECLQILLAAQPTQQQPVLLFAAVHHLLLREPDDALAQHYPNLAPHPRTDDPFPAFRAFCRRHEAALRTIVATRRTQTNEVGRCALLVPALGTIADEVGGALGLLDVGASSGLNLLFDRYRYVYSLDTSEARPPTAGRDPSLATTTASGSAGSEYDSGVDHTQVVGAPSPVVLECGVRGDPPVPRQLPVVTARLGLDQAPIDVTDLDEARWLEACVWPDQRDRFARLEAALAIARRDPPPIVRGDAVTDVEPAIERVGQRAHPTVINSWVLNYLTTGQRVAYLDRLDGIGRRRDLSWIYVESPVQIDGLPTPDDPSTAHLTIVTLVRWRDGRRTIEHVATAHPHGYWLRWH